jgi:hypothetical protein
MYENNELKFTAILNPKIEVPKLMNTLGHLTAGLINKLKEIDELPFLNYEFNSDRVEPSVISLYPFIILKAKNNNQLKTLHQKVNDLGIVHNVFTDTMLAANAIEQMSNTKNTNLEDLIYFGIVLFGDREQLAELTRKFFVFTV